MPRVRVDDDPPDLSKGLADEPPVLSFEAPHLCVRTTENKTANPEHEVGGWPSSLVMVDESHQAMNVAVYTHSEYLTLRPEERRNAGVTRDGRYHLVLTDVQLDP